MCMMCAGRAQTFENVVYKALQSNVSILALKVTTTLATREVNSGYTVQPWIVAVVVGEPVPVATVDEGGGTGVAHKDAPHQNSASSTKNLVQKDERLNTSALKKHHHSYLLPGGLDRRITLKLVAQDASMASRGTLYWAHDVVKVIDGVLDTKVHGLLMPNVIPVHGPPAHFAQNLKVDPVGNCDTATDCTQPICIPANPEDKVV
jgi:hypothetical protein